jgi:hypothetical protein
MDKDVELGSMGSTLQDSADDNSVTEKLKVDTPLHHFGETELKCGSQCAYTNVPYIPPQNLGLRSAGKGMNNLPCG